MISTDSGTLSHFNELCENVIYLYIMSNMKYIKK